MLSQCNNYVLKWNRFSVANKKKNEGINLIHSRNAMTTLFIKWIIKVLELGQSSLHILLRYCFLQYQPCLGRKWDPSMDFFTLPRHQRVYSLEYGDNSLETNVTKSFVCTAK